MPLPDDYLPAVEALGRAFATYAEARGHMPVLVGGAAAALFTDGLFQSGDFDIVAASDEAFDAAMRAHGFRAEDRAGKLRIGWYHPDHPRYGFQQVSTRLYDGRGDPDRSVRVVVAADSVIVLTAIEDLIADRLGQYAAAGEDTSRLEQARALLAMADDVDFAYLRRRVAEEDGDIGLLDLDGARGADDRH